jgi:hypothetical protein
MKSEKGDLYILTLYEQFDKIVKRVNENKKDRIEVIFNNKKKYISIYEIINIWEFDEDNFCWI